MNDNVRAELLAKLAKQNFAAVTPGIRADLLHFYSDPNAPYATKRKAKEWNKLQVDLKRLKDSTLAPSATESSRAGSEHLCERNIGEPPPYVPGCTISDAP
jgi:hypothetical protein